MKCKMPSSVTARNIAVDPSPPSTRGTHGPTHVPTWCACIGQPGDDTQLARSRPMKPNTRHSETSSKISCGRKVETRGEGSLRRQPRALSTGTTQGFGGSRGGQGGKPEGHG